MGVLEGKADTSAAFAEAMDLLGPDAADIIEPEETRDDERPSTKKSKESKVKEEKNPVDELEALQNEEDQEDTITLEDDEEIEEEISPVLDRSWKRLKSSQKELERMKAEFNRERASFKQASADTDLWKTDSMTALKKTFSQVLNTDDEEVIMSHIESLHQDLTYNILSLEDLPEELQSDRRARQLQLEIDTLKKENERKQKDEEAMKLKLEQERQIASAKNEIISGIKSSENAEALKEIAPLMDYDPAEVVWDILVSAYEMDIELSVEEAIYKANKHFSDKTERLRAQLKLEKPRKQTKVRRTSTTSSRTQGSSSSVKSELSFDEIKKQQMERAQKNL